MPERVNYIPNPWAPYMDGSIWKFKKDEFGKMPNCTPYFIYRSSDRSCLLSMTRRVIGDYVYIRWLPAYIKVDNDLIPINSHEWETVYAPVDTWVTNEKEIDRYYENHR